MLWVTLQLSEKGELVFENTPLVIENTLKKLFPGNYFIPLYYDKSDKYYKKIYLFKGYLFLEYKEEYLKCYTNLKNTPYFIGTLNVNRKLSFINDTEIIRMKEQLNSMITPSIRIGDVVEILDGQFKKLNGNVIKFDPKTKRADVHLQLQCMNIVATNIPIAFLRNVTIDDEIAHPVEIKKMTLVEKLTSLFKEYKNNKNGLTRKDILKYLNLTPSEILVLSTYLMRLVKTKIICKKSTKKGYIFFYRVKKRKIFKKKNKKVKKLKKIKKHIRNKRKKRK